MKKIFFSLLILFAVALTSSASELLNIPYKNIKEEDKIKLNNDVWTNKISRRDSDYFVKIVSLFKSIFLPTYFPLIFLVLEVQI